MFKIVIVGSSIMTNTIYLSGDRTPVEIIGQDLYTSAGFYVRWERVYLVRLSRGWLYV